MKISLVIPVKNEAASIAHLLNSIAHQTRLPDEVVIVDGGSSDRTPELIEQWMNENNKHGWVSVICLAEATPGKGRNLGIAQAKYDWVALTDAGIRLESDWLQRLCQAVEQNAELKVVYGNYEPVTRTFFERCAALAYVAPKQLRNGNLVRGAFIASSLMRRDVWEAVGGFPDLRAAEDLIFMREIAARGFKTGWATEATVWWQLRPTLWQTFRKFVLYSRANVLAGQQHDWHYGVARQYIAALGLAILGLFLSPWFWLALPVGYGARVMKCIWSKREGRPWLQSLNPAQFAGVMLILLTIDLATFIGWGQALLTGSMMGRTEARRVGSSSR